MEPKIRIEGKDNWKIKTLSDISKKVVTKNTALKYDVTLTNSAEFGIISQLDFFDHKISNDKSISNYFIVEPDDFVYNPRVSVLAPVGPINRNLLGFPGVMSPLYYVFKVHDVDKEFLDYYFHTRLWHKFMYDKANCGARFDRLSISDSEFVKMPIYIPESKIEQGSVASFFRNFDNLISTTKSRISSLRQMRVASLQAMFPQKCATKPQIRFKGFNKDWEMNTLDSYLIPSKAKNTDGKYSKEDVLSVSGEYGIVNQIAFQGRSFAGASVLNYGVVETKDIVYTKSPLKLNPYGIIKANEGVSGIVSTLYAIYKCVEGVNPTFVQYYFELDTRLNDYLRPLVRKGAKNDMKVSSEGALIGNVVFPSYDEQTQIADYFKTLDKKIQLEEQKLESLKRIKSACLDKMFV